MHNSNLFGEKVPESPSAVKASRENRTHEIEKSIARHNRTGGNRSVTEGAEPWYKDHKGSAVAKPVSVTGGATFLNALNLMDGATLRVYHNEIQVTVPKKFTGHRRMPTRRKGDIQNFSKKSRMRMLRVFNRIQTKKLSDAIFISCTARHGSFDANEFQYRFQKLFLPALKEIIPNCCFLWKLEPHLSGKPHYHLLVWSFVRDFNITSEFYKRKIRKAWRNAIGQHDKSAQLYSCKIDSITSRKKAFRYLSKYMLKVSDYPDPQFSGRRWARSKNLPCSPITEVTLSGDRLYSLKAIVRLLLARKDKLSETMVEMMSSDYGFFIWFESPEILGALKFINDTTGLNRYMRYLETGNPEMSAQDFEQIAVAHGYSY